MCSIVFSALYAIVTIEISGLDLISSIWSVGITVALSAYVDAVKAAPQVYLQRVASRAVVFLSDQKFFVAVAGRYTDAEIGWSELLKGHFKHISLLLDISAMGVVSSL